MQQSGAEAARAFLTRLVPDQQVVDRACALTGELNSLDAIHLATALLLDDPRDPVTVFTHDARLGGAARARGLEVVDPLG
nr:MULTISPECIES: hypothetical protein [unclassified Actinomyces]